MRDIELVESEELRYDAYVLHNDQIKPKVDELCAFLKTSGLTIVTEGITWPKSLKSGIAEFIDELKDELLHDVQPHLDAARTLVVCVSDKLFKMELNMIKLRYWFALFSSLDPFIVDIFPCDFQRQSRHAHHCGGAGEEK